MINKLICLSLAILLTLLSVEIPDLANAENILSVFSLSTQNNLEITLGESKQSPNQLGLEIQKRLNSKRNEIGKLVILLIHPHGDYDRTETVFLAQREGGGLVLEMKIHWHRKLPFITRNHLTIINWEILNNQHLRAAVV